MKATTALDRTKAAWRAQWAAENLDADTERLITQATYDLYFGPIGDDDEDAPPYPGFETACDRIKLALRDLPSTLYLFDDWEDWSETEPEAHTCEECKGDGGPCDFCVDGSVDPEPYYALDRSEVVRIVVGKELAEYVR